MKKRIGYTPFRLPEKPFPLSLLVSEKNMFVMSSALFLSASRVSQVCLLFCAITKLW